MKKNIKRCQVCGKILKDTDERLICKECWKDLMEKRTNGGFERCVE